MPYCPIHNTGKQLMYLILTRDSSIGVRVPQRKLVSLCPTATDGETEAQQRGSKCCVQCATVTAQGWSLSQLCRGYMQYTFPVVHKCIE